MDMDISMDIQAKSVDINMDMDMDGKFHIHGNPDVYSISLWTEWFYTWNQPIRTQHHISLSAVLSCAAYRLPVCLSHVSSVILKKSFVGL